MRRDLPKIEMSARPQGLKFRAPAGAVAKWDKSVSLKAGPSEIAILGFIGEEGNTIAEVRRQLKAIGRGAVRLILSSPGGDAFQGIDIYNELREHPGAVTVVVRGMAASAASVIAMAGDRVEMGEAALMMIHGASGMVVGNAGDMAGFATLLALIDNEVAQLYARRTKLALDDVLEMMRQETYLTAKDAVRLGFADVAVAEPKQQFTSLGPIGAEAMCESLPNLLSAGLRAASGTAQVSMTLPGVSGHSKGMTMNTIQDQLSKLYESKTTNETRLGEISQLLGDSASPELRVEFDTLSSDTDKVDDQIRAKQYELRMSKAAQPVTAAHPALLRRPQAPYLNLKVQDQEEKFKGQNWTRKVIARALAFASIQQGNPVSAIDIAQERWGRTNPTLVNIIRMAAVPGFGTGSGEPGSELVTSDNRYTGDFLDYLYGMTVFDRLPLREVPARVMIKGTDGAATGYWVGESKAIPVTSGSASSVELTPLKVAAVAVASNEVLADSSPSAERWIRDQLVEALAQRVDQTFLSTSAAVAGTSPAGILEGLTPGTSAGNSAENIRQDILSLAAPFITAKNARNLWIVTHPTLGISLRFMKNALGQTEFTGVTTDGGTVEGFNLIFGDNVGTGDVIMLKPDEIWRIGDSGIQVAFSRDATIEQQTDPTGATDVPTAMTTTNATNMFQEDSTAIRIIRRISYQKRRPHAVSFIGDAAYGTPETP